ncbi:hypothetical protein FRB90_010307, partial [Tulasnella sp. 427]
MRFDEPLESTTMTGLLEHPQAPSTPKIKPAPTRLVVTGTTGDTTNPVISSSEYVYQSTHGLVNLNQDGIQAASKYIHSRMADTEYAPSTWRTQGLHYIPPVPPSSDTDADADAYTSQPAVKRTLDWIFFISAMNFSFWSDRGGEE